MSITEALAEEHKWINRMIDVLEKAAKKLENGENINPAILEQAVDFIRNFADKFHHAKEEEILFKEMVKKGMPEKESPVEAMLIEHDQGRNFVKGVLNGTEQLKKGSKKEVKDIIINAKGYIELLRDHIDKEDNILYPLAERMLGEEQDRINKEFHAAELRKGGDKTVKKYHKLVTSLENNLKWTKVVKMAKEKINKSMTLGEVVEKFPESAEVMMKYGLHCIGCHVASWETIEQGALGHGMAEKEIDKMIDEINSRIKQKTLTQSNGGS